MQPDGLLSVVIVNFNGGHGIEAALASVVARDDRRTEVIVVDNGSVDRSPDQIAADWPSVRLLSLGHNHGFAAAANRGGEVARGDWVCWLNPDTVVPPGAFGSLVRDLVADPVLAAVGPALCRPDGTPQPFSYGGDPSLAYVLRRAVARRWGQALHPWAGGPARDVDWVSGACLVVRRAALAQVGGFDEGYFLYFEDADWCRRARRSGYRIRFDPTVTVIHTSTPNPRDLPRRRHYRRSLHRYYRQHFGSLASALIGLLLQISD